MLPPTYGNFNSGNFHTYASNAITNLLETENLRSELHLKDECEDGIVTVNTIEPGKHYCTVRAYIEGQGWLVYETYRYPSPRDQAKA